ncbi:putative xanthine/uracil permease [Lachnellula hyalina]|uniref:Putative xanthine/uracil permease n=1 Tax=Lachnellula hyalina TaxID=1316788 RepID=A0A8H8QY86_9HELO|nr:putative xanthine/uracil permease [Lachnellula hyalina]TVY24335.1 putative xanthine/uracil permease [Lachnellula hyalina]
MVSFTTKLNDAVAGSIVGRRFRLQGSGHIKTRKNARFLTEIRAGLATFFAMAYIISVNATILTDSGGICVCTDAKDPTCATDVDYTLCLEGIHRDYITGTAAIAGFTSFCMGLFANMPIALAPGMGLNAYFTYTVVGFHGTGPVTYELALTAVFVEGFIFVALSLLGMRQWLARVIPTSIKLASSVGIGLYLTIIGMTYSAGIGIITGNTSTPLTLAGCRIEEQVQGVCPGSTKMRNPTMWLGIFGGGFLTAVLLAYKIKGAIIAGILLVSVVSWPRSTTVTYFPHTAVGNDSFDFFKKVVTFHPITKTLAAQDWNIAGITGQFWLALVTFLYVDILDCTGTLYSMARFAGAINPETQDFEGSAIAYLVDAFGISIGSLFGLSPVTTFVESGAGISEGGKTGITAMVTGICFFISIFFAPIFASIPPWATGCTLIIVGAMMASVARSINWKYIGDSLPAFITLAVMPFTYSIAYGLIAGIVSYIIINTTVWFIEVVSFGRIVAPDKEFKEAWTWKVKGGFLPAWLVRATKGKKDFWHEEPSSGLYELDSRSPSADGNINDWPLSIYDALSKARIERESCVHQLSSQAEPI